MNTNFIRTLLPNTPLSSVYTVTITILILTSCILTGTYLYYIKQKKKHPDKPAPKTLPFFSFTGLLLSCCMLLSIQTLKQTAISHGMGTDYAFTNHTATQLQTKIDKTPQEDVLPDDLSNTLIIYYRFGCRDCESIYETLTREIKDISRIYWVSSRSKQGLSLRKLYPIQTTPTGVYVKKDLSAITLPLDEQTPTGTFLHTENLNALLQALKNQI